MRDVVNRVVRSAHQRRRVGGSPFCHTGCWSTSARLPPIVAGHACFGRLPAAGVVTPFIEIHAEFDDFVRHDGYAACTNANRFIYTRGPARCTNFPSRPVPCSLVMKCLLRQLTLTARRWFVSPRIRGASLRYEEILMTVAAAQRTLPERAIEVRRAGNPFRNYFAQSGR